MGALYNSLIIIHRPHSRWYSAKSSICIHDSFTHSLQVQHSTQPTLIQPVSPARKHHRSTSRSVFALFYCTCSQPRARDRLESESLGFAVAPYVRCGKKSAYVLNRARPVRGGRRVGAGARAIHTQRTARFRGRPRAVAFRGGNDARQRVSRNQTTLSSTESNSRMCRSSSP